MTGRALPALIDEAAIVVCCGSGGVGKTTTAAALGVEGARRGRRVCVVTIDPAKRLADALGVAELGNEPSRMSGDWAGELWSVMLDTRTTFDALVARHAGTPEQAEGILSNRLYRNIAGALSGTQEYMAMEKLYELHEAGRFDLIVVDTPPTRNALDFLDAPRRLSRFLDNRVFRILITPTRAYLRAVSVASQTFLRTVSKVVGSEVIGDAIAFFRAFEGMEEGFRNRAEEVRGLLAGDTTAFVLVATPRRDAVAEAHFFADRLREGGIVVQALVVNRVHPRFGGAGTAATDRAHAVSLAALPGGAALAAFYRSRAELAEVAEREHEHFAALAADVAPAPVVAVPFLADDVHDLAGLTEVARHLVAAPDAGHTPRAGETPVGDTPVPST